VGAASAGAPPVLVSTIGGTYDQPSYDTPNLRIGNSTSYDFTNAQMVLYAYQPGTLNYGISETVNLGTIAPGGEIISWGTDPFAPGYLFANDYDDEYGQTTTQPGCAAQGYGYCSYVGNFRVTFSATWDNPAYGPSGTEIESVFSPTNNATGGFVGWEGLDPSGLSETIYDAHTGGAITGTLANIYVGSPAVPEPATWALTLIGIGGVGAVLRRKAKRDSSFASA
jgi:hypothetical protein